MTRRAVSRACGHPKDRREEYVWRIGGGDVMTWFHCASFETPDVSFCLMCDEYIPLGPSNDAPDEVRVEMEAARLQTEYRALSLIMSCPDELLTSPVGHLALCIFNHDHDTEHTP
jgi:hypothetical protein